MLRILRGSLKSGLEIFSEYKSRLDKDVSNKEDALVRSRDLHQRLDAELNAARQAREVAKGTKNIERADQAIEKLSLELQTAYYAMCECERILSMTRVKATDCFAKLLDFLQQYDENSMRDIAFGLATVSSIKESMLNALWQQTETILGVLETVDVEREMREIVTCVVEGQVQWDIHLCLSDSTSAPSSFSQLSENLNQEVSEDKDETKEKECAEPKDSSIEQSTIKRSQRFSLACHILSKARQTTKTVATFVRESLDMEAAYSKELDKIVNIRFPPSQFQTFDSCLEIFKNLV